MAAIDLGSNSFHFVLALAEHDEIRVINKISEKVQIAKGLIENKIISDETQALALAVIERFSQEAKLCAKTRIRVVGTNTLRKAKNAQKLIQEIERILGCPVEVISGREEARLIYLGVAHTSSDDGGKRLVIDIGGGSTELVIGQRFEPAVLESLHMGCITYSDLFFKEGIIDQDAFNAAVINARREVATVEKDYREMGWDEVKGSSGSIRCITEVAVALGLSSGEITLAILNELRKKVLKLGHISKLKLEGLKDDRRSIFPAGLAILTGIFEQLEIECLYYSQGALREGVLYDLLGKQSHEDVRDRTITAMQLRFTVDKQQAKKVQSNVRYLFDQVKSLWALEEEKYCEWLNRASLILDVGKMVSHSQFHKHGAYLVKHADLAGFSKFEQAILAVFILLHRRKFSPEILMLEEDIPFQLHQNIVRCAILLRLAVLFTHVQEDNIFSIKITVMQDNLILSFPARWFESHPLVAQDLEEEKKNLAKAGFKLITE